MAGIISRSGIAVTSPWCPLLARSFNAIAALATSRDDCQNLRALDRDSRRRGAAHGVHSAAAAADSPGTVIGSTCAILVGGHRRDGRQR
jgi:hypothetical protein